MALFLDRAQTLEILRGFNPWWAGLDQPTPAFRRLAYGFCLRALQDKQIQRAVFLSGPRRVGKTTILSQIAKTLVSEGTDPKAILYVSLDHPLLRLPSLEELLRVYHEAIWPEGRDAFLLLDEIQYSKHWDVEIKLLVDRRPEYRILAIGSAAVTRRGLVESGVGRWQTIRIPTLSFFEYLNVRGVDVSRMPVMKPMDLVSQDRDFASLAAPFRPLLPEFRRYLFVGGFPETAKLDDVASYQRLLREDVVERVVRHDMALLFGVRSIQELEKLFIYLCINSGGIFSVRNVASALGTTSVTVTNHLEVLEQANLIYRLPPIQTGGNKVLKARYKIYLVDAGLRNAVLLKGESVLSDPVELGKIVETTVLRHLYAYYYRDTPEIGYWRDTATSKKVDIIVRSPAYVIPVEIKYQAHAGLGPKDGLAVFCAKEDVPHAYLVTQQESDFGRLSLPGIATKFVRVPAHILTFLLGHAEQSLWS